MKDIVSSFARTLKAQIQADVFEKCAKLSTTETLYRLMYLVVLFANSFL